MWTSRKIVPNHAGKQRMMAGNHVDEHRLTRSVPAHDGDMLPEESISVYRVTINSTNLNMAVPGVYEVYYYYTGISSEIATVILTVIVE